MEGCVFFILQRREWFDLFFGGGGDSKEESFQLFIDPNLDFDLSLLDL